MELENELTVLENQKRAFNRSKDEYRHTVSYCEKYLPIMENDWVNMIWYCSILATKHLDFVMRFDNQAMDNRAEAGTISENSLPITVQRQRKSNSCHI